MDREFSNEDLIQFYTEKLQTAGVASAADLTKAVENVTADITLDISKKVSPEKQQEILKNNPDSVTIGEKTYGITYAYDSYYRKHTASITVPAEEIFVVEEVPVLPSGRTLTVKVTDAAYERFSGDNFEELKAKAEEYLLAKQWERFRYSADAPKEQKLKEFDPIVGTVPELPEPVKFGINPRTNEPAMAYAALTYSRPHWSSDTAYSVAYYKTQVEAQKAQEQALAQIETAKEEKRKEDERQQLLAPAKTAFSEVESMYSQIESDYGSFGLTWSDRSGLNSLIYNLRYEIERDPKGVLEKIAEIRKRMASAFEIKEKKDGVAKKVEEITAEKYSACPLCGGDLSDGSCRSGEHPVETIQFEIDEYGRETGPVMLSQIKVVTETEGEKIVARLMCSAGTGRKYYKGDIYLERGYDLGYGERWEGEIGDVVFEDFGKILTQEECERLKLEESQRPLPEGVIKIGDAVDAQGTAVFAKKDEEDERWRLVRVLPNGTVLGYKGFRSQSIASSPEQLIRDYYRGYPDLMRKALADYTASRAEAFPEDSPMAVAFKRATGAINAAQIASVSQETEQDEEELTVWKRRKLEEQVKEAEAKLAYRQAELTRALEKERARALNVSNGEAETEISRSGTRVVANFDKTDSDGNYYEEIVEWPSDTVVHLQAFDLQGMQYVEVVAPVPEGTFYSEDLGLKGVTLLVKKVDLAEGDDAVNIQQDKIIKLRRRLG